MTDPDVDLVLACYAAFARGDIEAALAALMPVPELPPTQAAARSATAAQADLSRVRVITSSFGRERPRAGRASVAASGWARPG
jgi:hypothetical protein